MARSAELRFIFEALHWNIATYMYEWKIQKEKVKVDVKQHNKQIILWSQGCLFGSAALKVVHWRTLISLQDMHMVHLQIYKE